MGTENTESGLAAKHIIWLVLAVATLAAIVLLSIFAEGAHVEAVIAFAVGLLVPGSPVAGVTRRAVDRATPVAVLFLALAIAIPAQGCGAGALRAHARASSVLVVAIQGADELADTGAEIALAGCTDAACEDHVVEVTEAIDAGIAAAMLPVGAYVQSVEMALAGGDDVDVLSALFSVLARALAAWDDLVPLFAPLGVELPPLPASVRALVDLLAPSGAAS